MKRTTFLILSALVAAPALTASNAVFAATSKEPSASTEPMNAPAKQKGVKHLRHKHDRHATRHIAKHPAA